LKTNKIKNLVITVGISGCGKSTWLKDKSPVVETDDIRKELLGDVSDISQEAPIFDTARKRIAKLFKTHDTVYFGATNVETKHRVPFLESIKDICKHEFVIDVIIFDCDPKVSKKRVKRDLKKGLDRADSLNIIKEQYNQYLKALKKIPKEKGVYRYIHYAKQS